MEPSSSLTKEEATPEAASCVGCEVNVICIIMLFNLIISKLSEQVFEVGIKKAYERGCVNGFWFDKKESCEFSLKVK